MKYIIVEILCIFTSEMGIVIPSLLYALNGFSFVWLLLSIWKVQYLYQKWSWSQQFCYLYIPIVKYCLDISLLIIILSYAHDIGMNTSLYKLTPLTNY